jgi:prevent-host-death family protein
MHIDVSEAADRLDELVRQAETGEEVILTLHGDPVVRLAPVVATTRKERLAIIEAVRASAARRVKSGPSAARSQDFLYGDDGLPG